MDFIDISKRRIMTRQFSTVPVEHEKIDKILEAGRWAPTAVNAQPQRILVLNTKESLEMSGSKYKSGERMVIFRVFEKAVRNICQYCSDKNRADEGSLAKL